MKLTALAALIATGTASAEQAPLRAVAAVNYRHSRGGLTFNL
jgi:hypothetical protein